MLIAADVGGTKTLMALCSLPDAPGDLPRRIAQSSFASGDHENLESIIERFLVELGPKRPGMIHAACFGIAGPVVSGRSATPNLPWVIDAHAIAQRFEIPAVMLINDLVATAVRVSTLAPEDVTTLSPGVLGAQPPRTRVVVAAGTGLGVAQLVEKDGRWLALPSEGGHICFAPRTAEECALLSFLQRRYGRVSLERVVSGRGLANIYDFLIDRGDPEPHPEIRALVAADPEGAPRVISEHGQTRKCPVASHALEIFVQLYGAAAGNFALVALATDGVFIGGGIAPKILPLLQDGRFVSAFVDKGRFRSLMESIPLYVIEDPETALNGAAIEAGRIALGAQETLP